MIFKAVFCLLVILCLTEARSSYKSTYGKFNKAWKGLQGLGLLKENNVHQMTIDDEETLNAASLLLRGVPMGSQAQKAPVYSVASFNWQSCGAADQLVEIRNLTIKPDPLSFPGPLTFGFDIIFHDTISAEAKVKTALKLQINTRGTWIDIPCIGSIGSCTYDDLCELLQKIQCPQDLKDQNIPCACPFNKGEYKLQKYSVDVEASVFLTGDYRANAILTDSEKGQIACYTVNFTVA